LKYPGIRGLGWQGQTCVKNLPQVGVEVCTKFGRDWYGQFACERGTQVIFFTYKDGTNNSKLTTHELFLCKLFSKNTPEK